MIKEKTYPNWLKLDNAAKIFPSVSNKRDTKVFRFTAVLKEEINKEFLQKAMLKTLENFPLYKSTLRRGIFWYYLEISDEIPTVVCEDLPICYPLYSKGVKSLLFRVSYFGNRINLEVYHALADGAGAILFLQDMIANYLVLKYEKKLKNITIDLDYNASISEKISDSFKKYYDETGKKNKAKLKSAYQIKGAKHKEYRIEVIEGILVASKVLDIAHKYNTTLTCFLAAVFMQAIYEEMSIKERKKQVVLNIPVNLRKIFKSLSARNFFGVFNVPYDFKNEKSDLESIIKYLDNFFKEKLNFDEMTKLINAFYSLEKNVIVRTIPLFIKDFVLKQATKISEITYTARLSNVGIVKMPKTLKDYIDYFSVSVSTNKTGITMCSFEEKLVVTFSSPLINTDIQKNFFRILSGFDLDVVVASNMGDKHE